MNLMTFNGTFARHFIYTFSQLCSCGADQQLVRISIFPLVLQDYFADSKRKVHKDRIQNYKLLYARENHTHTVLAFSRELQTCDPDDTEITVGENYSDVSSVCFIITRSIQDSGELNPKCCAMFAFSKG